MSWTRSKVITGLLLLAGAGAALLAVPGDRHAPDPLQSDFAVCTAWAAGGIGTGGGGGGGGGSSCSCSGWVDQGCGTGGCSPFTMGKTRTCSPSGCNSTSTCASSSACCSCSGWVAKGCQQGGCQKGYMFYTQTCSPNGCGGGTAYCGWNSTCPQPQCVTGPWNDYGCGSCGEGRRYRYRTTNPAYCATTSECISDSSCPVDPNKIWSNWKPYGFALPGDAQYGFTYKDNEKQDFLALAAKGNVVIGDYTSGQFTSNVLPKLKPGGQSVTQPYAIDSTDAALGYHTGNKGVMYDAKGRPLFDGDYVQKDGGVKLDGKDRRFYESTLPDKDFQKLINPYDPLFYKYSEAKLDGVFYTNHAVAGAVNAQALVLNGALVSRDDALMFREHLFLNHDTRLMDASASKLALPVSIKRPKLRSWKECPASGCP